MRLHHFAAICCLLLLPSSHCLLNAAELLPVSIQQKDGELILQVVEDSTASGPSPGAVVIRSRAGRDSWQRIEADGQPGSGVFTDVLGAASRSTGGGNTSGAGVLSASLDQLLGRSRLRGGPRFLTPVQGTHINPRITIRRRADDQAPEKYPAAVATLVAENSPPIQIKLPGGKEKITWAEIADLPAGLKNGLPPGEYALKLNNKVEVVFSVANADVQQRLNASIDRIRQLLGGKHPALATQYAVELLLDHEAAGDALDMLERSPAGESTAYLKSAKQELLKQLQGEKQPASQPQHGGTGIAVIDQARSEIDANRWDDARATLGTPEASATPRAAALSQMYQAVVMAESGQATGDQAAQLFEQSIQALQAPGAGAPHDLSRAYNNYASHLQNRVQDRLYNHAFQVATQTDSPLLVALHDWLKARESYQQALQTAGDDPAAIAALQMNLGRQYALLADILNLASQTSQAPDLKAAATTAVETATRYIKQALDAKGAKPDALTTATGQEVLANLAYRSGDMTICRAHAFAAQGSYLEAGSLAGVESVQRLLGMLGGDNALNHLEISHLLAELLRQRIAMDDAGQSRAGFLARRAYVNERMIDLLVAAGKPRRALQLAEAAKARALEDVLLQRKISGEDEAPADFLDAWPAGSTGVAYYIGSQHAWCFWVDPQTNVHGVKLTDAAGQPLASSQLIADVHNLLLHMQRQASKMLKQRRFDHSWQPQLHTLCKQLLPPAALEQMRQSQRVVFAPHHILHYLPFAALVTQSDTEERGRFEIPQAKFLIDESFEIVTAPSLTAWRRLRAADGSARGRVNAVGIVEFDLAPPLPGVEQDLANLNEVFGDQVSKVTAGADATEVNVKRLLRRKGLLFIATHGENIADRPLDSYLLCQTDDESDGRLTAGEIFSSTTGASIIVMSACYTGLADRSPMPGDDLFGLRRAMLHSGAGAVIAGVWDIYDGTAPLITRELFKGLSTGQTAAAALRTAQRKFLQEQRELGPRNPWTHPYFWAVYTVTGNDLAKLQ